MNARSILAFLFALVLAHPSSGLAQSAQPFALPSSPDLVVPTMADEALDGLITALDDALPAGRAGGDTAGPDADALHSTLWSFARRLQAARLTAPQQARALDGLEAIGQRRPDVAPLLDAPARMIRTLSVGKTAPDIVGRDLDGGEFRLSDYRGKVVVLVFSADWCAICRSLYPYERFLVELYGSWPFAMLGVDASATPESAARSKAKHGLSYRSWWDEPTAGAPDGSISAAWNARGRPTVYEIDGDGVIRFVDLRYEDLLKGVRQVLNEHMLAVDRATVRR